MADITFEYDENGIHRVLVESGSAADTAAAFRLLERCAPEFQSMNAKLKTPPPAKRPERGAVR